MEKRNQEINENVNVNEKKDCFSPECTDIERLCQILENMIDRALQGLPEFYARNIRRKIHKDINIFFKAFAGGDFKKAILNTSNPLDTMFFNIVEKIKKIEKI